MFVHSATKAPVDPFQFNEAHLCEEHCSSKSRQTGCEKESSRRAQWGDPVSDPEELHAESKAEHDQARDAEPRPQHRATVPRRDAVKENIVWKGLSWCGGTSKLK